MQLIDLVKRMDDNEKITIDTNVESWNWSGTVGELRESYDYESMTMKRGEVDKIFYSTIYNSIYIKIGGIL